MSYYPPSGSSYPYSAYHPPSANAYHSQHTPGTYPTTAYQQPYPSTTVQGYGATWPYAYGYYAPQQQQAQGAAKPAITRPTVSTGFQSTQPAAGTSANTTASPSVAHPPSGQNAPSTSTLQATGPQRTYSTPYTYVPAYRDSVTAASSGGARGSKKSSFRGLFTKECEHRTRHRVPLSP